jgi:hypothetical protein
MNGVRETRLIEDVCKKKLVGRGNGVPVIWMTALVFPYV